MKTQQLAQLSSTKLDDISANVIGLSPDFVGKGLSAFVSNTITGYIFTIAGLISFVYFALGGFEILTSQGDPGKLDKGRKKLQYAVIGFLVVFGAYWIVQVVSRIFLLEQITTMFS
jgi:uncharacterized membrane protein